MTVLQYLVLGLAVGAMFALLAVGIVLTYRASGVLNFAHASTGVLATYVNFELLGRFDALPVGGALLAALATGAGTGVLVHRLAFVPLEHASQVTKLLASFGVAGVVQGVIGLVWTGLGTPSTARTLLPLDRTVGLAGVRVTHQHVALIVCGVGATLALTWLLHRTTFGMQVRALAQNPLAARLAGVDDRAVQTRVWALAGASAALAGVLVVPFGTLNPLSLMGFQLKALAAGLTGGFVSLPASLGGGLGLGVAQELLAGGPGPLPGLAGALAALLVVMLLVLRVERFFVSDQEARALEDADRGLRAAPGSVPLGRARWWLAGFGVAAVVTLGLSGFWAFVSARTMVFALLGLSIVVLTGWSGQVSLMPGTFAGVGACLAWILGGRLGLPLPLVLPLAGGATVVLCAAVGVVALRLRPLYLAVATIALAGLFEETLFRQRWFANAGEAMSLTRPDLVAGDRAFAVLCALVAAALFAFTAALGRSRTGRALAMVRDNPKAAAAAGANPTKYRLVAFTLHAVYAGVAGVLFAYLLETFSAGAFGFLVLSLSAFGLTLVGGLRSPLGPVIGAFAFVFLTEVFRGEGTVSDWTAVALGAGIVLVLVRDPDGLVGIATRTLRRLAPPRPAPASDAEGVAADRTSVDPVTDDAPGAVGAGALAPRPRAAAPRPRAAIAAERVRVRFDGVVALDDVDLAVAPGEIVGLIGANGAGKTTLLDVLSGFTAPAAGRVLLDGRDITRLHPYRRARQGLARSFQDPRLFPSMTVREVLLGAFHPRFSSGIVAEGLALPNAVAEERAVVAAAEEVLGVVDLHRYLDHRVATLSFGSTRALELAWLAARQPRVLLLDEPASGLQQSEVAALGGLIERIRGDAAVVLVDHDVPFVAGLADRLVALDLGRVLASGDPEAVLADPAVVDAYLGGGTPAGAGAATAGAPAEAAR